MTQAPPTRPEVARIEIKAFQKLILPGAKNIPRALVKITKDESLGLVNENRSKIIGIFFSGIATDETKRVVIIFKLFAVWS
jgi:hypothetical protein